MTVASTLANTYLKQNYKVAPALSFNLLEDFPAIKMLVRMKNAYAEMGGSYQAYAASDGPANGGSPDFSTAQGQAKLNMYGSGGQFLIPPVSYNIVTRFPGIFAAQAATNETRFISVLDKSMKDAYYKLLQDMSSQLWGNGYQIIGQVSAITTTNVANDTIVLVDANTLQNFYPLSSFIDVAASSNSGNLRARGTGITTIGMQVYKVDPNIPGLVFAQSVTDATNGIPTLAVGDYIFIAQANATTTAVSQQGFIGLAQLCPTGGVAQTETSFFNVDRRNSRGYVGTSFNASGYSSLTDAITTAHAVHQGQRHQSVNRFVCNALTFNAVQKELRDRDRTNPVVTQQRVIAAQDLIQEGLLEKDSEDGFIRGIDIGGALLVKDPSVPSNVIWGFKEGELEYLPLADGLVPWDQDGLGPMVRASDADQLEIRHIAYHNVFSSKLNNIINIQINPVTA